MFGLGALLGAKNPRQGGLFDGGRECPKHRTTLEKRNRMNGRLCKAERA
jgi:hypothetical protein